MRAAIAALVLTACVEDEQWTAQDPGDGALFLVDAAAEQFPDRARPAEFSEARFAADLPAFTGRKYPEKTDLVVVDPGRDIRVIYSGHDLQMLVYLPRHDLHDVLWKPTFAAAGDEGAGVDLPVGHTVYADETRGDEIQLIAQNDAVSFQAWIPDDAVDQWWTLPNAPEHVPALDDDHRLPSGWSILNAPWGEAFAFLMTATWVAETGEREGEYVEVEFDADGWRVRGWVELPNHALHYGLGMRGQYSSGCGLYRDVVPRHVLPPGTPLYVEPGGEQVARITSERMISSDGLDGHAIEILEQTPWGVATLWAEPEDVLLIGL